MGISGAALERFADVVFSSRRKDREFWLGESGLLTREEIEEHYGSLKPCLHGSDAHRQDEVGEVEQGRLCWLKGDLPSSARHNWRPAIPRRHFSWAWPKHVRAIPRRQSDSGKKSSPTPRRTPAGAR